MNVHASIYAQIFEQVNQNAEYEGFYILDMKIDSNISAHREYKRAYHIDYVKVPVIAIVLGNSRMWNNNNGVGYGTYDKGENETLVVLVGCYSQEQKLVEVKEVFRIVDRVEGQAYKKKEHELDPPVYPDMEKPFDGGLVSIGLSFREFKRETDVSIGSNVSRYGGSILEFSYQTLKRNVNKKICFIAQSYDKDEFSSRITKL